MQKYKVNRKHLVVKVIITSTNITSEERSSMVFSETDVCEKLLACILVIFVVICVYLYILFYFNLIFDCFCLAHTFDSMISFF